MTGYTFYFINIRGRVLDFDFAQCADDGHATEVAREELSQHMSAQFVDIFNGEAVIMRLARDTARPNARP